MTTDFTALSDQELRNKLSSKKADYEVEILWSGKMGILKKISDEIMEIKTELDRRGIPN